jgi:PIN domain nuclease of toxin-antitoxin system
MVILDTCGIIELCREHPSLSQKCLREIEKGSLVLSASFAELACKIKLGKLTLNVFAEDLYKNYKMVPTITIVDIGCREWFDSITLEWDHKDPVDRLIVSYAGETGSYIVTTDKKIKKYYKKVMW